MLKIKQTILNGIIQTNVRFYVFLCYKTRHITGQQLFHVENGSLVTSVVTKRNGLALVINGRFVPESRDAPRRENVSIKKNCLKILMDLRIVIFNIQNILEWASYLIYLSNMINRNKDGKLLTRKAIVKLNPSVFVLE